MSAADRRGRTARAARARPSGRVSYRTFRSVGNRRPKLNKCNTLFTFLAVAARATRPGCSPHCRASLTPEMTTLGFQAYCRRERGSRARGAARRLHDRCRGSRRRRPAVVRQRLDAAAVRRRLPSLRRARVAGAPGREPDRDAGRSGDSGDHGRRAGRRVRRHGAAPVARRADAGRRRRGARRHGPRHQRQPDLFGVASGAGEAARRAGPAATSGAGAGDQLLPGRVRALPAVPGAVAAGHRGDARQPRGRGAGAPARPIRG